MQAAAHNPKFAAEADIPQSVAREYVEADKKKKSSSKHYRMGARPR